SGVTSSSLTPSCSQMISFTFCSTLVAISSLLLSHRSHEESAVHVQHVAGDRAGGGGREEAPRRSHVIGRGDAADRDHGRVERLLLLPEASRHLSLHETGGDRVHRHTA